MVLSVAVAFLLISCSAASAASAASADQELPPLLVSRIAFGSCANQSTTQPVWDAIMEYKPDVFIWMGDNIYGDNKRPFMVFGEERTIGPWKNTPRFYAASEHEMSYKYQLIKSNPGYSRLRNSTLKVIGTWDDHDYGLNNAGKEFDHKVTNQRLMLDFLDEPSDSPRRKQAGVYASYTFGPVGRQIKVILLDTRYHRDPIGSDGTILGSEQWAWLEKEMNGPATDLTIIGSSIQVISNLSATTGPLFSMESWGHFPRERARLFKLISDSKRDGVLFVSGDVHFGEVTRYDCATCYPLYDITASGLTQAVEKAVPPPLHFIVRFLAWFTPSTMRVMDKSCRQSSCTYGEPNFGTIQIDWDNTPPNIKIEVRDINGVPVIGLNISLSQLQAHGAYCKVNAEKDKFQKFCTLEVDLPLVVRYRLAILVFCSFAALLLLLVGIVWAVTNYAVHFHKFKLD